MKTFEAISEFTLDKGVRVSRGAKVQLPDRIAKKFSRVLVEKDGKSEKAVGRNSAVPR